MSPISARRHTLTASKAQHVSTVAVLLLRHLCHLTISKNHRTVAMPTAHRTLLGASVQAAAFFLQRLLLIHSSRAESCTKSVPIRAAFLQAITPHRRRAPTRTRRISWGVKSITPMSLHLLRHRTPIQAMIVLTQPRIPAAVRLMCQPTNSKPSPCLSRTMHLLRVTRMLLQLRPPRHLMEASPVLMRIQITKLALRIPKSANFKARQCKCLLPIAPATTRLTLQ